MTKSHDNTYKVDVIWGCSHNTHTHTHTQISTYCFNGLAVGTASNAVHTAIACDFGRSRCLFQGWPFIFQKDNAKPHTTSITAWLRYRRVRLACLQSRPFTN
ncbi:hypothetical protein AMELA_G00068820 [Ameiurus melas]|uniref:Uncharacterized protein n=1 Tax=Ameiurus melas TaxID=219545 RepID=A0A7J6B3H2_AMEME|nr:hypothetical protein AMELA_G00068820 [Ameiurus melas]